MGVLDLDRRFNLKEGGEEVLGWYRPRPWIQLEMSTLEGAYPPSGVMLSPQDMVFVMDGALQHGAAGLALFNIMARGNELLSTLAADIPWTEAPCAEEMVRRYVALRYGRCAQDDMERSFGAYQHSVDAALLMPGFFTMGYRRLDASKVSRGFEFIYTSGESQLQAWLEDEERDPAWIEQKIEEFVPKLAFGKEALRYAKRMSETLEGSVLYLYYLWELSYVLIRWEGVINLFSAHRMHESSSRKAVFFQRAIEAFHRVKDLYSGLPEYSMEQLPSLAPEVEYTPYFLANWRNYDAKARQWKDVIGRFHVVWERFPEYEDVLMRLRP